MKTKTFEELCPKDNIYVCRFDGSGAYIAEIKLCKKGEIEFYYKAHPCEIKTSQNFKIKSNFTYGFDMIFSCENEFKQFIRSKRVERLNNMISKIEQEIEDVKEFRKQNYPLFSGDYYTKKINELNIF